MAEDGYNGNGDYYTDLCDVDTIKAEFNADVDFVKDFSTRRTAFLTENFGVVQEQDIEDDPITDALQGAGSGLNDLVESIIGGGNGAGDNTTPDTDTDNDANIDTDLGTDTDNNTDTDTGADGDTDTNGNNNENTSIPDTVAGASVVTAAVVALASGLGIAVVSAKKKEE